MLKKILKLIFNIFLYTLKKIYSFFIYLILLSFFIFSISFNFSYKKNNLKLFYSSLILENINVAYDKNTLNPDFILFKDLYEAMSKAAIDDKISKLYINLNTVNLSTSQIEELMPIFQKFKDGNKEIIAFAEYIDNSNYKLAILADKIIMPNSVNAGIKIGGYSFNIKYYGDLLKKYGINFEIINTGDYKTFGEEYIKNTISKENKETLTRINDKNFEDYLDNISKYRKIEKSKLKNKLLNGSYSLLTPKEARDLSLIDEVYDFPKYYNIIDKEQNEMISVENYLLLNQNKYKNSQNKIAIIYLDGLISNDNLNINYESFIKKLKTAQKINGVKGIIIRINSSGGLAIESKKIFDELFNLNIPIYTSIANVAASGGYYIASASDKIFANKSSITGSIGVVSMAINFENALNKVGINTNKINNGKYYELNDLQNKEDREKYKEHLVKIYNEFKNDILKTRTKLDEVSLEKIAQGKVFRADEALNYNLIDKIGGLYETIDAMQKDLNLEDDFNIVHIYTEKNIEEIIPELIKKFTLSKMSNLNYLFNNKNEIKFLLNQNEKALYFYPFIENSIF